MYCQWDSGLAAGASTKKITSGTRRTRALKSVSENPVAAGTKGE
jgi:hypothetical protein